MEKRRWTRPEAIIEEFVPNEYVAACGLLDDGETWFQTIDPNKAISEETAYKRKAGEPILDAEIYDPHPIFMGSFYRLVIENGVIVDKIEDSTSSGYQHQDPAEDWGEKDCVREDSHSPWGYHYHFIKTTNMS